MPSLLAVPACKASIRPASPAASRRSCIAGGTLSGSPPLLIFCCESSTLPFLQLLNWVLFFSFFLSFFFSPSFVPFHYCCLRLSLVFFLRSFCFLPRTFLESTLLRLDRLQLNSPDSYSKTFIAFFSSSSPLKRGSGAGHETALILLGQAISRVLFPLGLVLDPPPLCTELRPANRR